MAGEHAPHLPLAQAPEDGRLVAACRRKQVTSGRESDGLHSSYMIFQRAHQFAAGRVPQANDRLGAAGRQFLWAVEKHDAKGFARMGVDLQSLLAAVEIVDADGAVIAGGGSQSATGCERHAIGFALSRGNGKTQLQLLGFIDSQQAAAADAARSLPLGERHR